MTGKPDPSDLVVLSCCDAYRAAPRKPLWPSRVAVAGLGGLGHLGITADIELLPSTRVAEAVDRLDRGDVRYRFVLDLSDLD